MVAQPDAVHQPRVDVGGEQVGHGLDGRLAQTVLVAGSVAGAVLAQLTPHLVLHLVAAEHGLAGLSAVVQQVHEQGEVLQEQLTLDSWPP